ncbi:MAG TPA: iron-containing redox enzyme family protein [Actinomycetota bacterium]|nr:iron-containing redox enzyme family protein [Actinomycetota bacterium]
MSMMSGDVTLGPPVAVGDPLADDDLHLALYLCYELHYRSLDGVADSMEWDPALLSFRRGLETAFERGLRAAFRPVPTERPIDVQLRAVIGSNEGPSLSSFLAHHGDLEMYREFLVHRSAYHLKEADPHSFGIPRLRGRSKLALIEIQRDEYGGGDLEWMHSGLFAQAMRGLELDDREGAYIDRLPGSTLATTNLMSLFGMHRRLRGALVGHLAAFEMTSCIPNRRYGDGLRRLGFGPEVTAYFDEHVEADAAHGAIAANDMAGSLVLDDPELSADVLFGAAAMLGLDGLVASRLIDAWSGGTSSLHRSAVARAVG